MLDKKIVPCERVEVKSGDLSSLPSARTSPEAWPPTALIALLNAWIGEELVGVAELGTEVPNRVRLHIHGIHGRMGWNEASSHIHVWVKTLREGDRELLMTLSEPGSVHKNREDTSFRVHNEVDVRVLRELIRRHVAASAP